MNCLRCSDEIQEKKYVLKFKKMVQRLTCSRYRLLS